METKEMDEIDIELEEMKRLAEETEYDHDFSICECGDPITPVGIPDRGGDKEVLDEYAHIRGRFFQRTSTLNRDGTCDNPRPKRLARK